MHNSHSENELELAKFGEYLLRNRIVAEKYAPYYVGWVRKFLVQVPERAGIGVQGTDTRRDRP
jgi:hypothetical protein